MAKEKEEVVIIKMRSRFRETLGIMRHRCIRFPSLGFTCMFCEESIGKIRLKELRSKYKI